MSKPSGRMRCSEHPVAAQVRAMLPQFWGISGSMFYYIFNFVVAFVMEKIEKRMNYYH